MKKRKQILIEEEEDEDDNDMDEVEEQIGVGYVMKTKPSDPNRRPTVGNVK